MNTDIKIRISFNKSNQLQLSIIIVNYNVKYFLEQCLCSVINACKNIETEIFVVDNNSTDGTKEFFKQRFSDVRFIWSNENNGFGKANNLALKEALGKYILFLNPDTILPEDCLEKCITFFNQQVDMGALGVRMINGSGVFLKESKRGFPSMLASLCKLSGLTALFPTSKFFSRYYLGHLTQNKNHEVDVLSGAFMMIKKSVLDKTEGFDERFFMYGEDVDLSYRIQKAGFKNIYFSESTIIHFKGESTKRNSLTYVRLFYGAMSLFVKKHYNKSIAVFYSLLIQAAISVKTLLGGIGYIVNLLLNKPGLPFHRERCLIVADKKEVNFVKSVLQKNSTDVEIIGIINPQDSMGENATGNLEQLPELINRLRAKQIIFCINEFSTKQMITLIQQLPTDLNFRFHFTGSASIVGSKRQDINGVGIA